MTNRRDFFKTSSLLIAGSLIGNQMLQASNLQAKGKKAVWAVGASGYVAMMK